MFGAAHVKCLKMLFHQVIHCIGLHAGEVIGGGGGGGGVRWIYGTTLPLICTSRKEVSFRSHEDLKRKSEMYMSDVTEWCDTSKKWFI